MEGAFPLPRPWPGRAAWRGGGAGDELAPPPPAALRQTSRSQGAQGPLDSSKTALDRKPLRSKIA
jgi:hypothetical protein